MSHFPCTNGLPRSVDLVVASVLLILGSPIWALIAIAVSLSSPGPTLYRATRVGFNGKTFQLLKFRSMRLTQSGPAITTSHDNRITPFGRVLRSAKLDEVPQLINIVRGDMALVGPRPEDPKYVAFYNHEQRRLLDVRPGITSPASIRYRHEEEILARAADTERYYIEVVMPEKLQMDLRWLDERTPWTDLKLIAATLIALGNKQED